MDDESCKKVKIGNGVKSHGRSGWGEVRPHGEEGTETNYKKVKRWAQLRVQSGRWDWAEKRRQDLRIMHVVRFDHSALTSLTTLCTPVHSHVYTHTHTHTCTHACTHACTHTHNTHIHSQNIHSHISSLILQLKTRGTSAPFRLTFNKAGLVRFFCGLL